MDETTPTVLFLCTGNYYRSRFAEHYFNHLAELDRLAWRAESRGLQLCPGLPGPMSRAALGQLAARGVAVPPDPRPPQPCTEDDLRRAGRVIAVKEAEHRPLLELCFPAWAGAVEFWHIHDIDYALPEHALPELEARVESLVARLRAAADDRRSA